MTEPCPKCRVFGFCFCQQGKQMTPLERLESYVYPDVDDNLPRRLWPEASEAIKWAIARIRQLERVEAAAREMLDHASGFFVRWQDFAALNDALKAPLPHVSTSQSKATGAV
jgi:hypothetical protein